MSRLTKTLLVALTATLAGGAAYVAAAPGGQSTATPAAAVDVKGPCDEPEHANDPRCAGPQVPEDNDENEVGDDPLGDDVRGPCDEPEHANDPRCAGPQVPEDNDDEPGEVEDHANRGPGSLNSGPGNARDRGDAPVEDNSGPGSSSSGSGHSGSDDSGSDDSGSGSSGSGSSGSGSSGPG